MCGEEEERKLACDLACDFKGSPLALMGRFALTGKVNEVLVPTA